MKKIRLRKHTNLPFILILIILIVFILQNKHISLSKKIIDIMLLEDNIKIDNEDIFSYYSFNPFFISNNINISIPNPDIYIYNTHDKEMYLDKFGVIDAANLIKRNLKEDDIEVFIENDLVSASKLGYIDEYKISRVYMEKVIKTYPNLKLLVDLHRDGVDRLASYIEKDGKSYAKILFVQGVRYENYEANLKLANKISDMLNERCEGISKGILLKDKEYQHDDYNQDLSVNSILLELGTNNNTWEEVSNTIDILVPVLKEIIYEKKNN